MKEGVKSQHKLFSILIFFSSYCKIFTGYILKKYREKILRNYLISNPFPIAITVLKYIKFLPYFVLSLFFYVVIFGSSDPIGDIQNILDVFLIKGLFVFVVVYICLTIQRARLNYLTIYPPKNLYRKMFMSFILIALPLALAIYDLQNYNYITQDVGEFGYLLGVIFILFSIKSIIPLPALRLSQVFFMLVVVFFCLYSFLFEVTAHPLQIDNLRSLSGIDLVYIIGLSMLFYWVNQTRKIITFLSTRIIVNPFDTRSEDNKEDLHALGTLFTQSLVTELHTIANLGSLEKVETANAIRMDSDQIKPIIAGSLENLSLDKMAAVTSVDLPFGNMKIKIPGSIFKWVLSYFSKLQIKGTIIRRLDNSYEIYIENEGKRSNKPILIQETVIPKFSTRVLTEKEMCQVARKIALKLALEMEVGSPFFTREEGLSEYLLGLQASAEQKWWLAIAHYRRCIEVEETVQGEFGIGHYLLGSALVSQGNYEKGILQLRMAESQGPQIPEIYYMLTLALLYQNYFQLHKEEKKFIEMMRYCQKAILIKPGFAEAYHLTAICYYLRGRILDRENSQKYEEKTADFDKSKKYNNYVFNYYRSSVFFTKALRHYWAKIIQLVLNVSYSGRGEISKTTYIDILIASHQKADALRGLRCYNEAARYYEEVLIGLPKNLRTLVDLAKNYCLNKKWKKAKEVIVHRIQTMDEGKWDADVNLYAGWMYAGLANDNKSNCKERFDNLNKSFSHLDFALHQRPRYMTRWGQNDWLSTFEEACNRFLENKNIPVRGELKLDSFESECEAKENCEEHKNMAAIFLWWLGWRQFTFDFDQSKLAHPEGVANNLIWESNQLSTDESKGEDAVNFQSPQDYRLGEYYRFLIDALEDLIKLKKVDKSKVDPSVLSRHFSKEIETRGLSHSLSYAAISSQLLEKWRKFEEGWKYLESKKGLIDNCKQQYSLCDRLFAGIYAEFSSLTSLVLASAQDYQNLYEVAKVASENLNNWTKSWSQRYDDIDQENDTEVEQKFRFSQYVVRYQLASLYSWAAYALLNYKNESNNFYPPKMEKFQFTNWDKFIDKNDKDIIRSVLLDIEEALKIMPMHPLAMSVHSELLRIQKQFSPAIAELERLLKKIEPFDPSRTVARPGRSSKSNDEKKSIRNQLYIREQLIGRQRFENFVNSFQIYLQMSKIYEDKGNAEQCIEQMAKAISVTKPNQASIQNFLILSNRLKNQTRFREAFAILDAIFVSLKGARIEDSLSFFATNAISILKTSLYNRKGENGKSLELGKKIARKYSPTNYLLSWENLTPESDENKNKQHTLFSVKFENYLRDTKLINAMLETDSERFKNEFNLDYWGETVLQRFKDQYIQLLERLKQYEDRIKNDNYLGLVREEVEKETNEKQNEKTIVEKPLALPKIFSRDRNKFPNLLKLAWPWIIVYQKENDVQNFLNQFFQKLFKRKTDHTILAWFHRYILAVGESSLEEIIRLSDLCNAIGYSRAELDLRLDLAETNSLFSLTILHFIYENVDKSVDEGLVPRIKQKLAQSYDTLSWIYFRLSNKHARNRPNKRGEFLIKAQSAAEIALRYDQQMEVVFYHLARIHLTQLEDAWQGLTSKRNEEIAKIAPVIDKHLRLAFRNWRSAQHLPKSERLQVQLVWLGKRLYTYQERWDNNHLKAFDLFSNNGINLRIGEQFLTNQ